MRGAKRLQITTAGGLELLLAYRDGKRLSR